MHSFNDQVNSFDVYPSEFEPQMESRFKLQINSLAGELDSFTMQIYCDFGAKT